MPEHSRQSLDRRVVRLWRVAGGLAMLAIVLPAVIAGVFFLVGLPGTLTTTIVLCVWALIGVIALLVLGPGPAWKFRAWSYRVDDRVVQLRNGVCWQTSVAIPLSRLQHVDLHRGPLERRFDLVSLELHTAGTQHASHTIPGLDVNVAQVLRDQLVRSIDDA